MGTAIQTEITQILPEGKPATKLKFLLALKFDKNDNVGRYKVRMVFQVKRISTVDWERTFTPVVDKVTVILLFSQAAVHQMHLLQMDVTTAF